MKAGDIMVICHPTSPNDGKRVRILQAAHGYNQETDDFEADFVDAEVLDTGLCGGIHKRFLAEVQ
ncbi:hypothetical protein M3I54_22610 [Paraburkholderia sp. CNPSo 3274]|uniref:hypothetical protein n=1 Tax=Paraburkholderia sp. CNPSo 3274 TaxID=2940932 RepID=UPI0020B75B50|nr:hypothetical protein [Paraburkholderia sp. CNPSo 3274]MCP3709739.1 hypothetical protein [Paraburkholderia sp. CNPSo 3274]